MFTKIKTYGRHVYSQTSWLVLIFLFISADLAAQSFSSVSGHGIPPLTNAKARWADFNNDGLLDLFASGTNSGGSLITAVYISNGNNTFNVISLTGVSDLGFDIAD